MKRIETAEYDAGIVPGMKKAGIKEGVKKEISDKQNQAKPENAPDVKEGSEGAKGQDTPDDKFLDFFHA